MLHHFIKLHTICPYTNNLHVPPIIFISPHSSIFPISLLEKFLSSGKSLETPEVYNKVFKGCFGSEDFDSWVKLIKLPLSLAKLSTSKRGQVFSLLLITSYIKKFDFEEKIVNLLNPSVLHKPKINDYWIFWIWGNFDRNNPPKIEGQHS